MITSDFVFGMVTGCLCTVIVSVLIMARFLSPFIKEAAKRSR